MSGPKHEASSAIARPSNKVRTNAREGIGSKALPLIDQEAEHLAALVLKALNEAKDGEEPREFLAFVLRDELTHVFLRILAELVADPDSFAFFKSLAARSAAKESAGRRYETSAKFNFLRWVATELERNPSLSRNALAQSYARAHPGTSPSSLRKYLQKGALQQLRKGVD